MRRNRLRILSSLAMQHREPICAPAGPENLQPRDRGMDAATGNTGNRPDVWPLFRAVGPCMRRIAEIAKQPPNLHSLPRLTLIAGESSSSWRFGAPVFGPANVAKTCLDTAAVFCNTSHPICGLLSAGICQRAADELPCPFSAALLHRNQCWEFCRQTARPSVSAIPESVPVGSAHSGAQCCSPAHCGREIGGRQSRNCCTSVDPFGKRNESYVT